ncbi:hypothetical protein CAPTEDRAFT_205519, partial [Capitella teleta]
FQKRTLHLLVEIRSLLQRAVSQPGELVERGQQNSLYYAAKQFTHIHEFPDLNTEDKQLWIKRCQALGGKDPRDMVKNIMKRSRFATDQEPVKSRRESERRPTQEMTGSGSLPLELKVDMQVPSAHSAKKGKRFGGGCFLPPPCPCDVRR